MATTTIVSYQPYRVGNTFPSWLIPLNTDAGTDDITGVNLADITLYFRNTSVTPPTDSVGTGTISIQSANPAQILYKPSATDVASPFTGAIVVKAKFPPSHSTADEVVYDPLIFSITY